uniref:Cytochrome P450 4461J1 n=1 Tax=Maconellicoccus hirsutus TaxID=177089 RepID=A0AAT9UTP1_MACHI
MVLLLVVATFVTIFLSIRRVYFRRHQRYYELLKQFPSPPTYPFIGNLKPSHFVSDDFLKTFEELLKSHDRLVYWIGPKPILLLKNFDDISTILHQNSDRNFFGLGNQWFGEGIVTNRYAEWKKSKKLLTPAFSSEMLFKYCDVFNRKSSALVQQLKSFAGSGEEIDIHEYVMNTNVEVILENVMGVSTEKSGKEVKGFGVALEHGIQDVLKRHVSPWLYPHIIYSTYLKLSGRMKFVETLKRLPEEVVKETIIKVNNDTCSTENVDSSKCVVDLLIKARHQDSCFTETRLRDELLQVISTGSETSALNVSFTLLMLAIHQDIQVCNSYRFHNTKNDCYIILQQKVYEEITQLVGEHEEFTSDHLFNHLKYLEQCIRETLRMFNPAASILRQTQKEHVLKDNTIVPADLSIGIVFHLAHRDTALYENPHKWNPENFSTQAIASRPKGSDLNFSIGPRSCIGTKYAILSNKSQIAQIIHNYHLSTSIKELKPEYLKMDISIRSKVGFPIRFTHRKKTRPENI